MTSGDAEASNLLRVPGGTRFLNSTPGANDSFPGDNPHRVLR